MQNQEDIDATSSGEAIATPADVAEILERLNVIKASAGEVLASSESTGDGFLTLVRDATTCKVCVTQLFPNGIPTDQSFFDRLGELHACFAFTRGGEEAIGIVWSEALQGLTAEGRQMLLRKFVGQPSHEVMEALPSLWIVVRDHTFPAGFLAEWFVDLIRVVERDGMHHGAWMAIQTLCTCHVDTALDVLQQLRSSPETTRLNIAGFMLGMMRTLALSGQHESAFRKAEAFFRDHADVQFRGVFNWSWTTAARERALTPEELASLFVRAGQSAEDRDTVICVACQLVFVARDVSDGTAHRCREWIATQVSPVLSSEAKHAVVRAAHTITRSGADGDTSPQDVDEWILAIQSVPLECVGIWQTIGAFLCDLLKKNPEQFTTTFERLSVTEAATIHRLMNDRHLSRLQIDMHNAGMGDLVGRLCVSLDMDKRRLGLYLFDSLAIQEFPQTAFASSGIASRLLFYESQRVMLSPKAIARILVAVAPTAEGARDGFEDRVFDELKLQAHNYAGECRTELSTRGKSITIVAKALEEVAEYFTDLERAHKAGINAMEVPGYRRAVKEYRRRFSRLVAKGAKSHSPLLSFVKTTQLLYGGRASTYFSGTLSDANPLISSSVSMEMPFILYSDPEEMAMRRLYASRSIDRLLDPCDTGETSPGANNE